MTYEHTYKENSNVPAATNYFHAKNDDPFVQSLGNIFKIATIFQDQSTNGASTCLSISYAYNQYTLGTSVYRHDQIVGTVDGVETTTNYTYSSDANQPLFPITTATTNSDGKITTVANKYITHSDYINSSTASESMLAKRMKNLNIIAHPIEVITKVGTSQVSGGKSEFSCFSVSTGLPATDTVNNFPYPYKVYSLNKDISWKLNVTVNRYDKGLPAQMARAGTNRSRIVATNLQFFERNSYPSVF